jgi:hypothetical protein
MRVPERTKEKFSWDKRRPLGGLPLFLGRGFNGWFSDD